MIGRILVASLVFCGAAQAQGLSPMKADIVTFGDVGAVRATIRNPYATARRFEIEVFDLDWQPVTDVQVTRTKLSLAPGGQTSLFAMLPVEDDGRSVYLCATSIPYRPGSAGIRGQVCGRYRVVRRSL